MSFPWKKGFIIPSLKGSQIRFDPRPNVFFHLI